MIEPRRLNFTADQLRVFAVVARSATLSRAADTLGLTQGAVSQAIAQLERALAVQLLERRSGSRVIVTPAGRNLLPICTSALRELAGVAEAARAHVSLEAGTLRIGAGPTVASHHLPPLLSNFVSEHPGVSVEVIVETTASVLERVASGDLDCGIVDDSSGHQRLEVRRVVQDEMIAVVAGGHPLTRAPRLTPGVLSRHVLLTREEGAGLDVYARTLLSEVYASTRRITFSQTEALRSAVKSGLGMAVLPRVLVSHELELGELVILPVRPQRRWIVAVRRTGSRIPAVDAFWGLLPSARSG